MIVKERDPVAPSGRWEWAGAKAEQQMAFYLRRRFGERRDVHVFNDLRVVREGETAQIDHLVLHKHGLIVIESKSVTGEVHINEHLEFVRVNGNRRQGMPSPIQQALRQGQLLRKLLNDNRESLRGRKLLGLLQGGFSYCPAQVLVAISDQGIIHRPKREVPELHKADQVPDEVDAIVTRHRNGAKALLNPDGDWGMYSMDPVEIERVIAFLLAQHVPAAGDKVDDRGAGLGSASDTPGEGAVRDETPTQAVTERRSRRSKRRGRPRDERSASHPRRLDQDDLVERARSSRGVDEPAARGEVPHVTPSVVVAPERGHPSSDPASSGITARASLPTYLCTHCHSSNLEIRFGYSYYHRCGDCGGNTPIRNHCGTCGASAKTVKRGREFYAVCSACDRSDLFFINPSGT